MLIINEGQKYFFDPHIINIEKRKKNDYKVHQTKSIKNVQALLSKAKERKKQGVFVVEGPKMSFEAPYDW